VSDLRQNLRNEFGDPEYRYAYAESFLNTKLATQIKTLREQREKTQAELGAVVGTKQSGFSRFEDVNHSVWKTDTLWKIARALGVRIDISFMTFGSLIEEKERFSKESLQRPDFEHDPDFQEAQASEPNEVGSLMELIAQSAALRRGRNSPPTPINTSRLYGAATGAPPQTAIGTFIRKPNVTATAQALRSQAQ
jgi:transcriptional regulator with XRE-family HTH domain